MTEKRGIARLNVAGSDLPEDLKTVVKVINLNAEALEILFDEVVKLKEQVKSLERRSVGY